jgi:hypothetical protein
MCGATSYRRVVARDEAGAMRATALYQCSGCSVVFADPKAWREGVGTTATGRPLEPSTVPVPAPMSPNLATYGLSPHMPKG